MHITIDPLVEAIVHPAWCVVEHLVVVEHDARLDEPLRRAAEVLRSSGESAAITTAVRTMYKQVGLDPTRTRPSSEALLRRVRKGDALPRVNNVVDIINWCSVESQLPFGLYDADRVVGDVALRIGAHGEEYAGIRKDVVHVAGRLTLSDALGPFGNPTSDSARTMVTTAASRLLIVIFVPAGTAAEYGEQTLALTKSRLEQYAR